MDLEDILGMKYELWQGSVERGGVRGEKGKWRVVKACLLLVMMSSCVTLQLRLVSNSLYYGDSFLTIAPFSYKYQISIFP